MFGKRALFRLLGGLGLLALLGAGAVVAVATLNPRAAVEWYAARALGRPLTLGELRIGWGNRLSVEVRDLRLANTDWGREADMLRVEYLSAEVDIEALWGGVLRFRRLRLEKPVLSLERGDGEARNWRFKDGGAPSRGGLAIVPKNRTQFPTLIDFALRDGVLVFRAKDRRDLRLNFYSVGVRSSGDDSPAHLTLDGAYNGASVQLKADTDSFAHLRDDAIPFATAFSIQTVPGTVSFKGTMTEPVDFEGVKGALQIDAQNLGDLLKIVGADAAVSVPLRLTGAFDKTGDRWAISSSNGQLASSDFGGEIALDEGKRGEADRIKTALRFGRLYLAPLLAGGGTGGPVSLRPDDRPGAIFEARLAARQLIYGAVQLADVDLRGRTEPGQILVDALSFGLAGGRIESSGAARAVAAGGAVTAQASLSSLDVAQLMSSLGGAANQLSGQLDGRATLSMEGETASDALKASRGEAALAMTGGRVARDLLEKASADLRALFRKEEGAAPLSCFLGVIELRDGIATLAPLRLRTADTTLIGGGRADLLAQRLDVMVKAVGSSPSVLALKVPLRVSGPFDKPSVRPYLGSPVPYLDPTTQEAPLQALAPELRQFAERNPCIR